MINGVGLVPVTCLGLCHVHLEQIKQAERGGRTKTHAPSWRARPSAGGGAPPNQVRDLAPRHRATTLAKTLPKGGPAGGLLTGQGDVFVVVVYDFFLGDVQGALRNHVTRLFHTGQAGIAVENIGTRNVLHDHSRKNRWVTELRGKGTRVNDVLLWSNLTKKLFYAGHQCSSHIISCLCVMVPESMCLLRPHELSLPILSPNNQVFTGRAYQSKLLNHIKFTNIINA